jgi:hypothetical protein
MPTPSPTITASVVANWGPCVTLEISRVSVSPAPTPMIAAPIDSPIAMTEPVARIRMTIAKARPINSVSGGLNSASD